MHAKGLYHWRVFFFFFFGGKLGHWKKIFCRFSQRISKSISKIKLAFVYALSCNSINTFFILWKGDPLAFLSFYPFIHDNIGHMSFEKIINLRHPCPWNHWWRNTQLGSLILIFDIYDYSFMITLTIKILTK